MIKGVSFVCVMVGLASGYINNSPHIVTDSRIVGMDDPPTECSSLYSCLNCNTARVCRPLGDGKWSQVTTVPCGGDLPFCDYATGTCSNVQDIQCGEKDTFICPVKDGYFPNVSCSKYHICTNYVSTTYQCKEGLNYNPITEKCENNVACGEFECDAENNGRKVPNSVFPNFFAYCTHNVSGVIDKCPGPYELSICHQTCVAMCHEEGVIPDLEDNTQYFKCTYVEADDGNQVLVKEKKSCPDNMRFENFMCDSNFSPEPTPTEPPTSQLTSLVPTTIQPGPFTHTPNYTTPAGNTTEAWTGSEPPETTPV